MSSRAFLGATYIFTAGVLQSSGQDLGCSSPKCLPLPLGTEHMKLLLLLLRQRVTITDLWKEREESEWMLPCRIPRPAESFCKQRHNVAIDRMSFVCMYVSYVSLTYKSCLTLSNKGTKAILCRFLSQPPCLLTNIVKTNLSNIMKLHLLCSYCVTAMCAYRDHW